MEIGNSWRNGSGFTFVELMIVVAIIGMLSTFFVTQYPAIQRRSRDSERRSDIKQYQTGMETYANRNNGNYLAATGNIVSQCTALGLSNCSDDPDTTRHYQVNSTTAQYVIWARLEQPLTPITFFVVCSSGRTVETTTEPTSSNCP